MKKYTDKELSLILSQHTAGMLVRHGTAFYRGPCCIVQCAKVCVVMPSLFSHEYEDESGITWFDDTYQSSWTEDEFLQEMEKVGLA